MKFIATLIFSLLMLSSCGSQQVKSIPPKTETNNVEIGNKPIITITGSYVQPIR